MRVSRFRLTLGGGEECGIGVIEYAAAVLRRYCGGSGTMAAENWVERTGDGRPCTEESDHLLAISEKRCALISEGRASFDDIFERATGL